MRRRAELKFAPDTGSVEGQDHTRIEGLKAEESIL